MRHRTTLAMTVGCQELRHDFMTNHRYLHSTEYYSSIGARRLFSGHFSSTIWSYILQYLSMAAHLWRGNIVLYIILFSSIKNTCYAAMYTLASGILEVGLWTA